MVDTFTKWVEVEPVVKTTTKAAKRFLTKNVITRFGIPSRIIIDNGTQFSSKNFQEFYDDLGIKVHFASVAHPQSNGAVERAHGIIMQGIKRQVFDQLIK